MSIEIFLDIETIPTTNAEIQERKSGSVVPPGNYKKAETIAQWWATEGETKKAAAIQETALDGTWGELAAIGFAVNDDPVEVMLRGVTEASLLMDFGAKLNAICQGLMPSGSLWSATWIGHNLLDFDLRFLWQRSRILDVRLPFEFPPNKFNVYDTMKEWAGFKGWVKQTDLELAFGIPRSDPLENGGADVFKAYQAGRLDDVAEHCRQDVENLRKIYRRMKGA